MRSIPSILALLAACAFAGCGLPSLKPRAGDPCHTATAKSACEGTTTVLDCENDKYRAIPCRGPKGCSSAGCDMSADLAGDACPLASEGEAKCDPASSTRALKCTGGTFQPVQCSGSCSVSGGLVHC